MNAKDHDYLVRSNDLYDIVSISPASAGFGQYQVSGAHTGDPVNIYEYIGDIQADGCKVYQLGTDTIPDTIDDIRGLIQYQPNIVLAIVDAEGNLTYQGANLL